MKKAHFLTLLFLPILTLTGCSAKYGESSKLCGGYTSYKISEHEFVVDYEKGLFNSSNDPSLQDKIVMIRAAEVTLQNGGTHFTYTPFLAGVKVRVYDSKQAPAQSVDAKKFLTFQNENRKRSPS